MKTTIYSTRLLATLLVILLVHLQSFGLNYYWVGNGGNWSDFAHHWATTSGGAVFNVQPPTATDNVFFDANSISSANQTISMDISTGNCNNMTWTGITNNPTFYCTGGITLNVYGSLTFDPNMTLTYLNSTLIFNATTTGQTITSNGQQFDRAVIVFNGVGGGWTLQDDLYDNPQSGGNNVTVIYLNNGSLNTNGNTVTAGQVNSTNNNTRALTLGSSTLNLAEYDTIWNISGSGITFNAGTSTINADITGGADAQAFFGGNQNYYNLNFMNYGILGDNNSFNNLTFTQGCTYTLISGTTQTINGTLIASGTCSAFLTINASAPGSQASISQASGTVTLSYVYLQDNNATGGATFTANNSFDLGDNSGWTITPLSGGTLYWVGLGDGMSWSDGNNWSTSSGGPSSGCPPFLFNDVVFDANSSFPNGVVNIDIPTANCHNMTWTGVAGSPNFNGSYDTLNIYGSLTFDPNMSISFTYAVVNFNATSTGQTITSSGQGFDHTNICFNGVGGGWTLQDDLFDDPGGGYGVNTTVIYINNGSFNTNGNTVTAGQLNSTTSNTRSLTLGSSVLNLNEFDNMWLISATGLTFDAGTSTINANNTDGVSVQAFFGGNQNYYNLTFMNPGILANSNSFNNLTFTQAYTYTLISGTTQTINGALTANGTCNAFLTIHSSAQGNTATISQASGNVTVSYVFLQDIKGIGGATFTANNSVDLGDNPGWTITPPSGGPLYWVGLGDGTSWSDGNNWSTTSGGPSSGCPPNFLNDVIFDANSFSSLGQTVNIDIPVASCKSMTWTGVTNTPTFTNSNTLNIYGSLTLDPNMTLNCSYAILNFNATTTGQTITSNGQQFDHTTFSFNGAGGGWTLQDDLFDNPGGGYSVVTVIYLNNGSLNTNGHTVTAGQVNSTTNNTRSLTLGSSVLNLNESDTMWQISGTGITFNAGTSTINADNTDGSSVQAFVGGNQSYYNLSFLNPATMADNNSFTNLIINTGEIVTISSGGGNMQSISGVLTMESGTLSTNGNLTLTSTSVNSVAIIDNFSNNTYTGSINGNIIAQRYYAAPTTTNSYNQHEMGSPVNTPALSQFGASGTPGYVTDADCDGTKLDNGSPYGTVFGYDETHGAACGIEQWKVLTGGNAVNGVGYSIRSGGPGTLSLTGAPNISGDVTVDGTNSGWTNSTLQGYPEQSGWTLASNPYPATLQISAGSLSNNVDAGWDGVGVMVWNTTGASAGSYQLTTTLAPFQAFMVHITDAGTQSSPTSATYTIYATDRILSATTFYKEATASTLNITATNQSSGLTDVTTVGFNQNATNGFDPNFDVHKIAGDPDRHTLYTLSNGNWMCQNIHPSIEQTPIVPMSFSPGVSGTYTINFNGIASFDPTSYIMLEDTKSGVMYDVRNGDYTFTSDVSDGWNRFVLHFTPPASINTTNATCSEQGIIDIVQPGTAVWNYTLADNNNAILSSGTLNAASPVTASVPVGVYTLTLKDNNGYTVVKTVEVSGVQPVVASFAASANSVNVNQEVTLNSTSANAVLNSWNFGDGTTDNGTTVTHSYTTDGVYNVILNSTNASGCNSSVSNIITVTQSTTGVTNLNDISHILIWSNEDLVNVDFTPLKDVQANIEIYNILGQKLAEDKYVTNTVYHKELPNIEEGYIVVSVKNNDEIITQKLFISNAK